MSEDALALAAKAGIHRIPIPTPFMVGRVNVYLIDDEPLTLVDTGPNSGRSLDELEQGLAAIGRRIEDIELVLLTHQHMDHTGLAEIVVRRSGARVAALDTLGDYLADFRQSTRDDDEFSHSIMRRHGTPEDLALALRTVGSAYHGFGSRVNVTDRLRDGAAVELGDRRLRVLHRPGHSPTDTVFLDERRGIAFGGDHLIAHISSNPLISRPLNPAVHASPDAPGRPRALIAYLDSMRLTRDTEMALVLPGHGDPITAHAELVDERIRLHERRASKIDGLLERAPASAYELAHAMWGNVAVTQAYLTLSEVLGHLDLLAESGRVVERGEEAVVRFAREASR